MSSRASGVFLPADPDNVGRRILVRALDKNIGRMLFLAADPLIVAGFTKHFTANDQRRILNHPVEPWFCATNTRERGSRNRQETKECRSESHAFLDINSRRER